MTNITNPKVLTYYSDICKEWNFTPTQKTATGYESVEKDLKKLSKEAWTKADDAGKVLIQQEVFDIYRTKNILPITYYSLEGCEEELKNLTSKSVLLKNKQIPTGMTAGQSFSRFWFPNMQDAKTFNYSEVSLRHRFNNDKKLKAAIQICYKHRNEGDKAVLPQSIRRALDLTGGGTIQNFKTLNARAIYEYICPNMFGNVLDFSSGYGGRMLGSMTSNMRYNYTGIDPNTSTYVGLDALGSMLNDLSIGNGYQMNHCCSEDFDAPEKSFDAAFSSPPYFNLEIYSDEETQCMNRYNNLDAWFDFYVEPTLTMLYKVLVDNAIYAVNIADYDKGKTKVVDRWIELSKKLNFEHVDTLKMMLNVRPGKGNNKLKNGFKYEGVYIFQKK
jgi:hypothetical protein